MMHQDPDVILIGEIRDADTSKMALRATTTGNHAYPTLHTNSAIGAIPRLLDIGIFLDIMSGNIIAIVAQRLIRRLCLHCKTPYQAETRESRLLGSDSKSLRQIIFRPVSCERCDFRGYRGRLAIMEILRIADMDELIAAAAPSANPSDGRESRGLFTWPTTACAACSTARSRSRNSAASCWAGSTPQHG